MTETVLSNREKIRYLKQYVWLDRRINSRLEEVALWRSRLGKLTATISDMPKGGGSIFPSGDMAIIDKIVDLEAQIDREIDQLTDIRDKIGQAIFALVDVKERTLMDYRYLQGMTFEWIASEMKYSWRHTHRIHSNALKNIKI